MGIAFGSLCSGIEAATIAFRPLGWTCKWLSEIDPFCCTLLKYHYPDTPNVGDMLQIEGMLASNPWMAEIDVLQGSTPCQSFSLAGLRGSLDDKRGQLTLAYCRIVNAIDDIRERNGWHPLVATWENVPGILNTDDNAFGCFIGALAGDDSPLAVRKWSYAGLAIGPRRKVAWRVIDSQGYVPQRRRRVFVCASGNAGGIDPVRVLFEDEAELERDFGARSPSEIQSVLEGLRWNSTKSRKTRQEVAGPLGGSSQSGGFRTTDLDNQGAFIPTPMRLNGLSEYVQDDKAGAVRSRDYKEATDLIVTNAEGSDGLPYLTASGLSKQFNNQQPLVFDTTQVTHPANYSNPQPGDPCHPLAESGHPPAIAYAMRTNQTNSYGVGVQPDEAFTLEASKAGKQGVCVPIDLRQGARGETMTNDRKEGSSGGPPGTGVGQDGDPAFSLTSRQQGVVAMSFQSRIARNDRGQPKEVVDALRNDAGKTGKGDSAPLVAIAYRNAGDGCAYEEGDATAPLTTATEQNAQIIAFSQKDSGGDARDGLAPTLRALGHKESHANAGGQVAVAFRPHADADKGDQDNVVLSGRAMMPDVAAPLRSGSDSPAAHNKTNGTLIGTGASCRRLTCEECEILMGLPRGYTKIPVKKVKRERLLSPRADHDYCEINGEVWQLAADGNRYKVCGNSIVTQVLNWIGKRVDRELNSVFDVV